MARLDKKLKIEFLKILDRVCWGVIPQPLFIYYLMRNLDLTSNIRWNEKILFNWDQLSRDIGSIDWPQFIDCLEPELAWNRFEKIFFILVNRSIPKIKINGNFSSPWFDSECYEAYRSKERAHIKFKSVPSVSNELKRDATRKNFKNVCSAKKRENLYNRDHPVLITKKVLVSCQV